MNNLNELLVALKAKGISARIQDNEEYATTLEVSKNGGYASILVSTMVECTSVEKAVSSVEYYLKSNEQLANVKPATSVSIESEFE